MPARTIRPGSRRNKRGNDLDLNHSPGIPPPCARHASKRAITARRAASWPLHTPSPIHAPAQQRLSRDAAGAAPDLARFLYSSRAVSCADQQRLRAPRVKAIVRRHLHHARAQARAGGSCGGRRFMIN